MAIPRTILAILVLAAVTAGLATFVAVGQEAQAPKSDVLPESTEVTIPGLGKPLLAGPYMHKGLALFYLYQKKEEPKDLEYMLLDEGLASGEVKVSEAADAQVRTLIISNASDKHLFLQVGELVRGGKQDRTLQTSLVVPPKTLHAAIPSFCVERSRWSGGKDFAAQGMIAPSTDIRRAIHEQDQGGVWKSVQQYKSDNRAAMSASGDSKTSSVNEELESKDFQKALSDYEKALENVPSHSVPVGMVYAVNGRISTADIYRSGALFKKLYPKLLRSAAAEAIAQPASKDKPAIPTVQEVADFLAAAWDGPKQTEKLGMDNVFVRLTNDKTYTSQLFYKDKLIHAQVVKRTEGAKAPPIPEPPPPIPQPPRAPEPPRPLRE